jgi:hypothetical protein
MPTQIQTSRPAFTPLIDIPKGDDPGRIPLRDPRYRGDPNPLGRSTQTGRSLQQKLVMKQATDELHAALGKALDYARDSTEDLAIKRKIEVQRRLNKDKELGPVLRALEVLQDLGVDMTEAPTREVEAALAKYRSCLDPKIAAQRKMALEHLSETMQTELNAALLCHTISETQEKDLRQHWDHTKLQDDQLPSKAENARVFLEKTLTLDPETIKSVKNAIKDAEQAIEHFHSIGLKKSVEDPQKHAKRTQELFDAVVNALNEAEKGLEADNPLRTEIDQCRAQLKKDCAPKEAQDQAKEAQGLVEKLGESASEVIKPLKEAIAKHASVTTPQNANARHTQELLAAVDKALTAAEAHSVPGMLAGAQELRATLKRDCEPNEAQEQALEAQLLVEQLGDPGLDILNPLKEAIAKHASVTTPSIDTDDHDDDTGPPSAEQKAANMLDVLWGLVDKVTSVVPVIPADATKTQLQDAIRKSLEAMRDDPDGIAQYLEQDEKKELDLHLQRLDSGTVATDEHRAEALGFVTDMTREFARQMKEGFKEAFEELSEQIPDEARRKELLQEKDELLGEIDRIIGTPPVEKEKAKEKTGDTADSGEKPDMLKEIEKKTKWAKEIEAAEQAFGELQMIISFAKKVREWLLQILR